MKRRRFLRGTMRREGIFLQGGYSIFRGFHDSLFERGGRASRLVEHCQNEPSASGVTVYIRIYERIAVRRPAAPNEKGFILSVCLSVCL